MDLAADVVGCVSGVEPHRIRGGVHTPDDTVKVAAAVDELRGSGVFVDDRLGLTWPELMETAEPFVRCARTAAVVIDRPELMADGDFVSLSQSMKQLARTLSVPVVAVTWAAGGEAPVEATDLPGQGAIARAADLVALFEPSSPLQPPMLTICRSSRRDPSCVLVVSELFEGRGRGCQWQREAMPQAHAGAPPR